MGPVTGEVLARLVAGESQLYDLTPFRADRFNWRKGFRVAAYTE